MALHRRTQLRQAVVARLAGLPTSGPNVYATRLVPLDKDHHPAVLVYTLSETLQREEYGTLAQRSCRRVIELAIQCVAKQGDGLDNALDQMALEVEQAIATDETFGGLALDCGLSSSVMAVEGAGETGIGSIVLTYQFVYYAREADPSQG